MGILDGVDDQVAEQAGVFLAPGLYVLEVTEIASGVSKRNGGHRPLIVVNAVIDEVLASGSAHSAGEFVKWMQMMDRGESSLKSIKSFFAALLGGAKHATQEKMEALLLDCSPVVGTKVVVQATEILTSQGKPFTKMGWAIADEDYLKRTRTRRLAEQANVEIPNVEEVADNTISLDDIPF